MMEKINISIIIPVYNAKDSLRPLYLSLIRALEFAETFEIIMVDDCSGDSSAKIIEEIAKEDSRVSYAILGKNCGQQEASLLGISLAKYDYIATIDCDLQNPPELLEAMVKKLISSGTNIVYACPKKHKSDFGSGIRDLVFSVFFHLPEGVRLSSFRVFRRSVAEYVLKNRKSFIYFSAIVFTQETPAAMIEYDYAPRGKGKSGYNFLKKARLILGIIFYYSPLTGWIFRKKAGLTVKEYIKKAGF